MYSNACKLMTLSTAENFGEKVRPSQIFVATIPQASKSFAQCQPGHNCKHGLTVKDMSHSVFGDENSFCSGCNLYEQKVTNFACGSHEGRVCSKRLGNMKHEPEHHHQFRWQSMNKRSVFGLCYNSHIILRHARGLSHGLSSCVCRYFVAAQCDYGHVQLAKCVFD